MTVIIENETDESFDFPYEEVIRSVVSEALKSERCPFEAEVSVLLVSNEDIRAINSETRGIDRVTDVLSFPMLSFSNPADFSGISEDPDAFSPENGELLLGDIVISVEKVKDQAALYGHSEKRELSFLTAHSMLHLLGYDHPEHSEKDVSDTEPVLMYQKQEDILRALSITREL